MNFRSAIRIGLGSLGLLGGIRRLLGRNPDGSPHRKRRSNSEQTYSPASEVDERPAETVSELHNDNEYERKLAAERKTFASMVNVHDLPAIYHYWSNKYLLPAWKPYGFTCPDSFFCLYLVEQLVRNPNTIAKFVSIGAGNCDTEVRLAKMLIAQGFTNFTIECLDINADMLERGKRHAEDAGLGAKIIPILTDLNRWQHQHTYDAVIANQSLHHIEQLERVFTAVKAAIGHEGVFLTSDMIGRNGHMRWPEALTIVHEFWRELPSSYRYNLQLNRHEELYENWDCSNYGFEGIRAQDVLPLLIEFFHFRGFFAFANVIDPFIDRGFGHHFDATAKWDTDFIDRVQARDFTEMSAGNIRPTHILAAMTADQAKLDWYIPPFTPEFCVRNPRSL